ncbi:hypothetical protein WR25_05236 [Diploscapter pachys]|uniref:Peptidase M12A domain-containing protein n=1 Tax=Diploscapter pachys TaxID=2018661 RepID=A0A2A2L854_9BILA|nr:hypothetical protein WR25_05236 [Diploscapter pachys]
MEVRSDRDDRVTFSMDDVDPALRDGLAKLNSSTSSNPLIYNFGSVTHSSYDMYTYDGTTDYPMMAQLGQYYLSMGPGIITSYDFDMINKFYNCYDFCPTLFSLPECLNTGNINPRSYCRSCSCPLGFGGATCETHADGGQSLTATEEWQDLVLSVIGPASLDSPGPYVMDSAIIITPPGYNFAQFRFVNFTADCPYCTPGCRDFGLEIKYRNFPQRTSPRVCCNSFEGAAFSSMNNMTAVVLYSSTIDATAVVQYRASLDNITMQPSPPAYEVQSCQSEIPNLLPLPDEVCEVLMIHQSIILPIMDYLSDPIALVEILLTHGNCSNDSSGIEHGMTYTVGCPIVSGAARFFSVFFDMIGVEDDINQAGSYVTAFQIAFNAIHQSVQAGVESVTSEMCPEWVAEDVTTTASP